MAEISTSSLVQGWMNSGGKASSPEQALGQEAVPSTSPGTRTVGDGDEEIARSENSDQSDLESILEAGSEDAQSNSQDSKSKTKPGQDKGANPEISAKEVITITDEKGKRKVEVDFNDKDSLRKYVQMAHGARKWQAERDQAKQQATKISQEHEALKSNWKALEDAYSNGVEGLVDLLMGQQGSYKNFIAREIDKAKFLEKASPEERELFDTKERLARMEQADKRRQQEYETRVKAIDERTQQAELETLKGQVHPAFQKHAFDGKLGDSNDEQMFNRMLWNTAMDNLVPYEEQGKLTPEVVEREFRSVANTLSKRINVQAEKKAASAVAQKKQEATENVQAKVMSGYKSGGKTKEAADMLNNGNLTGLLKNWGKYKSVFNR